MELLLNQRTKKMLESVQLSGGRAYLFRGEKGMGRMTCARHMAAEYLGVPEVTLKDQPDYYELSADGRLGIGDLEDLRAFTGYLPANAPCKIAVIDAGEITEEAQASLLKLLEDGATHVAFIIVIAKKLLATVDSRCRLIDFYLVPEDEMQTLGEPVIARQLAAGRPGMFFELKKPEYADYLGACSDAADAVLSFDGKRLLESLHLVREKDKQAFFECYGRELVRLFLRYVGDRLDKQSIMDQVHCEAYRELSELTFAEYMVLRTATSYSKNDFFEHVRRVITCMK